MAPRGTALVGFAVLAVLPRAAVAQSRLGLAAEVGADFDDNVTQAERVDGQPSPPRVAAPLGRALVSGSAAARVTERQEAAATMGVAGRMAAAEAARSEDLAVVQSALSWRVRATDGIAAGAALGYYEAFQRADAVFARAFRSLAPAAIARARLGESDSLAASAGYRWFVYKSDGRFDFEAPTATMELRHVVVPDTGGDDAGAEWELGLLSFAERRAFAGDRLSYGCTAPTDPTSCSPMPGSGRREDRLLGGQAELTRTGRFLAGAGYALHVNLSNSYGEGLRRHVFFARVTAPLPARVYLSARADVRLTTYFDPVPIARNLTGTLQSIEDEARSSLRVELSRDLAARWQAVARWALYSNELGTNTVHYRRQVASLALAWSWDR